MTREIQNSPRRERSSDSGNATQPSKTGLRASNSTSRYRREVARPRCDDYRYGRICPDCAGLKREQSAQCWQCWIERRHDAAFWAKRTCPDCGGPKYRASARCRSCKYVQLSLLASGVQQP